MEERGLLRPGNADIALLDWSTGSPSNIAALALALDGIVREGMLSVVWPILDALVSTLMKEERIPAGTVELVEIIASLLPEVQFAIEQGLTDDTALCLPGIRKLANRGGTSRAVRVAGNIAALLPPMEIIPSKEKKSAPVMDPPFDKVWEKATETPLLIEDGVSIAIDWVDRKTSPRLFFFTLTLPGISDRVFQVMKDRWCHDLEYEGQCHAFASPPNADAFVSYEGEHAWLHWDAEQNVMVACDERKLLIDKDNLSRRMPPMQMSASLLTVLIGLVAQNGYMANNAPSLLYRLTRDGLIGEDIIRQVTRTLLQYPAISPAKLARALGKDVTLLHVLWPMLVEPVKFAGQGLIEGRALPVWINRILDISMRYAPYLAEAAKRGLIPAEDARWVGLTEIASSKAKKPAVEKAKELLEAFK